LHKKIVVITGANSGIGKSTAHALAAKGSEVYMVCRSEERGEAARQDIIQATGNAQVHLRLCDLSSQASLQEYGKALREELPRIDVLVNNAGATFGNRRLSSDGLEMTFALNHLGYFLNTHYLLDLLRKGQDKRIINVSSAGHKIVRKVDFNDLQSERNYREMLVYCLSKLFNIYFTTELAQRLSADDITVNCLHPGVVATNFGNSGGKWLRMLLPLGRRLMISADKGAATSIHLASSPEVQDISGQYFDKCKVAATTSLAQNKSHAERLWDMSLYLANVNAYGNV
jgi:NAD(P)-dependent dehydrogenase (short-subunit alcohol dehydrogenase family)